MKEKKLKINLLEAHAQLDLKVERKLHLLLLLLHCRDCCCNNLTGRLPCCKLAVRRMCSMFCYTPRQQLPHLQ